MKNVPLLYFITMVFELCVVIIGLVRINHLNTSLRYLLLTITYWFVVGVAEGIMSYYRIHNLWLIQCNTLVSLAFFVRIFYIWKPNQTYGKILISSFIGFTVLWVIAKFTFEPFDEGEIFTDSISSILILTTSMYVLIVLINEEKVVWKDDPKFWTSAAYIIYSSGTLLIFLLFQYLLKNSREVLLILYPINWVLIIISHFLYTRAFLCNPVDAGITNTSQIKQKE